MYLCQHINISSMYLYQPTLGTRFLLVHCCGPHFAPRSSSGTVTPTYGCQNWNWNIKAFFIAFMPICMITLCHIIKITPWTEMEKRNKIAQTQVLDLKIAQKTRNLRHIIIHAKTA